MIEQRCKHCTYCIFSFSFFFFIFSQSKVTIHGNRYIERQASENFEMKNIPKISRHYDEL